MKTPASSSSSFGVRFAAVSALGVMLFAGAESQAAPLTSFVKDATMQLATFPSDNYYNVRTFGGYNFTGVATATGYGQWPANTSTATFTTNDGLGHRTVGSFQDGVNNTTYLLLAGDGAAGFTRTDFGTGANPTNPISAALPAANFDWIGTTNQIVYNAGNSGDKNVRIATVTPSPFDVVLNTTYATSAANRIRNLRVGDVYNGYVYYGNAGSATNTNFYAMDLSTGTETLLGNWGATLADANGIWTVTERGGYLYVQSAADGIKVFNMTNATTVGSLYTTYTNAQIATALGAGANPLNIGLFGFDVTSDGSRMLMSGHGGDAAAQPNGTAAWEFVVPEPASLGLLSFGGLLLARRRRR